MTKINFNALDNIPDNTLLSIPEVARLKGVSQSAIRMYIKRNDVQFYQMGSRKYILKKDIFCFAKMTPPEDQPNIDVLQ